ECDAEHARLLARRFWIVHLDPDDMRRRRMEMADKSARRDLVIDIEQHMEEWADLLVRVEPARADPRSLLRDLGHRVHAASALELSEMEEGDMRVVDQILVAKSVATFDEAVFVVDGRIILMAETEIVLSGNQRLIGFRRIAHPNPDPVLALNHWIGAQKTFRRNVVLARDLDAFAGRIEERAVIGAANVVADEPPFRQRHVAMRADTVQRDDFAGAGAVKQDRRVEDAAAERCMLDLARLRADIPGVLHKFMDEAVEAIGIRGRVLWRDRVHHSPLEASA